MASLEKRLTKVLRNQKGKPLRKVVKELIDEFARYKLEQGGK